MKLSPRNEPFHLPLGRRGEMVAWNFLIGQGYKILEKNYRCVFGEIDVVAEKNKRLVFIEIKTRANDAFGRPEEAVHETKQQRLAKLASYYMKENGKTGSAARFEVVAVTWEKDGAPEFKLIENAFMADERMWQG